ncbi:MAG TPA: biopolymer transporter ExbD [Chthoniobacterales bacterium]
MRTTLLLWLLAIMLTICARARSPLLVDITTTDSGSSITFNAVPKTPDELEMYLRETVNSWGDHETIIVRPDDKTSFKVVFDILRRLKAAGVKRFEVQAGGGQWAVSRNRIHSSAHRRTFISSASSIHRLENRRRDDNTRNA